MKVLVLLILLMAFFTEVVDSSTSFVRTPDQTTSTTFNVTPSAHAALPVAIAVPPFWEKPQQIFLFADILIPRLNPPVFEINRPPIAA